MLNDPIVTWNLVLSCVAFPGLAWFIKREITKNSNELRENKRDLMEEIRSIRSCMSNMKQDIGEKVDKDDCETRSKEKWERLNHHRHTDRGEVVIPS